MYIDESFSKPQSQYFASKGADECVGVLYRKAEDWYKNIAANDYLTKVKLSWHYYHGSFFDSWRDSHRINFSGDQGEYANIAINHYRNIAKHMHVAITANRPVPQCRAANTDHKSLVQTKLGQGILEYYNREKKLDRYFSSCAEYAVVLASGYIKLGWDATKGDKVYDYDESTNTPIYPGDIDIKVLSPFDVVFDSTKEHQQDNEWVITRSWMNKFNVATKYFEHHDEIIGLTTKSESQAFRLHNFGFDETDDIAVYEFFHKPCDVLPKGRYMMFLANNIVLYDSLTVGSGMPYRNLPVYRMAPDEILGTPYGYTPMFDYLPIQDAVNSLYSSCLTNLNAFAIQNILVPRGADINVTQLSSGMNIIDYNHGMGEPHGLQMTHTPPELFQFLSLLERVGETITSINAVQRGDVNAISQLGARSGNALALVQAQTLQFLSGLQKSYTELQEDVWTGIIHILQDFAQTPRIAAIMGISNQAEMQEFNSDDISLIDRVFCDVGNPLSQQLGGRVQMAENLLQMFGDKFTPEQYMQVMNTGRLDLMTDPMLNRANSIKSENEILITGKIPAIAVITEMHHDHIHCHASILDDPYLKQDGALVKRVLEHIQQHIDILKNGDPILLAAMGQQPLSSQNPPPAPGAGLLPPGPSAPITGPNQVPPPPQPQQHMMGPSHKRQPMPMGMGPQQKLQHAQTSMPKPAGLPKSPTGGPLLPSQMMPQS